MLFFKNYFSDFLLYKGDENFRFGKTTTLNFPENGLKQIDCIIPIAAEDIKRNHKTLDCYATFQETIEKSGVRNHIQHQAVFEIFQENYDPPVTDLFEGFIGETST